MSGNSAANWFRDTWAFATIAMATALVVITFGLGFLILPRFQQGHHMSSTRDALDNALGFHGHGEAVSSAQPPVRVPTYVVWDESTIHEASNGDIKRGEFVAINCTACHGEKGMTEQTWIPNLAGVDRLVLYKQLADFKSGTRLSGPMSAIAQSLSLQQSADVAAYYSSLSGLPETGGGRLPEAGRSYHTTDAAKRLIFAGDPARGIAGCATCHGPAGYRIGAPALSRQNQVYIEQQLQNFAQGVRANDMNMPMRTIARLLKPDEMRALAVAYSNGTLR
jgi:cytochrome c553